MKIVVKSALLLSTLFALAACGSSGETSQSKVVIVNTAKATLVKSSARKEFSFISKPYRESDLSFRVGGPIEKFDLYLGNHYKRGQVIAQIDARDFVIRKERAEGLYNQAKAEFERIEVLYKKENISASAYEKAKAEYTSAKTAMQSASNELNDTRLVAPFDGYVGAVYIEKYQDVKATQPIVSFVDIDQLKIEAYVTQDIALNAKGIKSVNLYFDGASEVLYEARVAEISKSTTPNNLSYLLTAILANEDGKLLSGMSGNVLFEDIATDRGDSLIAVPQTAVRHTGMDGDYVWVVDTVNNTVEKRKITTGDLQSNGMVVVRSGLTEGETLATSSLRFLSDGQRVELSHTNTAQNTR